MAGRQGDIRSFERFTSSIKLPAYLHSRLGKL